jgi:hypothetical protein
MIAPRLSKGAGVTHASTAVRTAQTFRAKVFLQPLLGKVIIGDLENRKVHAGRVSL